MDIETQTQRQATHRDAGASLVDIIIGIVLATVVITIGVGLMQQTNKVDVDTLSGTQVQRELQAAQSILYRDVVDGISLRIADERELAFTVVRDGTCRVRHFYVADGSLMLGEEFYESEVCVGAFEVRVEKLVTHVNEGRIFTYEDEWQRDLGSPVTFFPEVRLIAWDLEAGNGATGKTMPLSSGAAFDHVPEATGTGGHQPQAMTPFLSVTTAHEGLADPALAWVDSSPALTGTWTVWRTLMLPGHPDDGDQLAVAMLLPDVATWTDTDLPAGATAVYRVQARLTTGAMGPASNPVVTGLRPTAPTVTATGQPTSIRLDWGAVPGADRYDIYRAGALVASVGDVLTWTDSLTYGNTHNYVVAAGNRWESLWLSGGLSQDYRATVGTQASKSFPGGATRALSATTGAFTAPGAPTITATPTTSGSTTVARTAWAGWTGAGPTAGRDRGWELQHRATGTSTWAALGGERTAASYSHTGRPAGGSDDYRARACNASGCGPWTGASSAIQRPPAPTCTVDSATTRSLRVTINRPTVANGYTAYEIVSNRAGGTDLGVSGEYRRVIDKLSDGVSHTFTVRTRNASPAGGGWSDAATCSGTTDALTASLGSITTTTRAITIAGRGTTGGLVVPNGTDRVLTIEKGASPNIQTFASWTSITADRSFDRLAHDTSYRVKLTVSDGHNSIAVSRTVRTDELAIGIGTVTTTTRGITILGTGASGGMTVTGGTDRTLTIEKGSGSGLTIYRSWATFSADRSFNELADGTSYRVKAVNGDGFNTVTATRTVSTKALAAPAASCTATVTDPTDPGSIRVSGGDQVRLGSGGTVYAGPRTFGSLSAGSYTGYARNTASDGLNTAYSSWDACPTRTINPPTPVWTGTKPPLTCSPVPTESDMRAMWLNNYGADFYTPSWDWEYMNDNGTNYWRLVAVRLDGKTVTTSGVYACGIGV